MHSGTKYVGAWSFRSSTKGYGVSRFDRSGGDARSIRGVVISYFV